MIWAESLLLQYGPQLLHPFDPSLINSASIDFRLGSTLYYPKIARRISILEEPFLLHPGEFILAETYEKITLPPELNIAADMLLKSSRAREGFNHSHAFWFDPGWSGVGTLELTNVGPEVLKLTYKMKMGQLRIFPLTGTVIHPYEGKYQHATSVEPSKDH